MVYTYKEIPLLNFLDFIILLRTICNYLVCMFWSYVLLASVGLFRCGFFRRKTKTLNGWNQLSSNTMVYEIMMSLAEGVL